MSNFFEAFYGKKVEELLEKLYNEQVGCCTTCIHYIGSDLPGYYTDFGDCLRDNPHFIKKYFDKNVECKDYVQKSWSDVIERN